MVRGKYQQQTWKTFVSDICAMAYLVGNVVVNFCDPLKRGSYWYCQMYPNGIHKELQDIQTLWKCE